MKRGAIFLIGLTVAGGAGWYWWTAFASPEVQFYSMCETVIKERLRAPSTYRRIKVEYASKALDAAGYYREKDLEYAAAASVELRALIYEDMQAGSKLVADGKIKPQLISANIQYDAANGFGTPIRSLANCQYFQERAVDKLYSSNLKLNGKTQLQYAIDALKP